MRRKVSLPNLIGIVTPTNSATLRSGVRRAGFIAGCSAVVKLCTLGRGRVVIVRAFESSTGDKPPTSSLILTASRRSDAATESC